MKRNIPFSDPKEQLKRLKEHQLLIEDDSFAIEQLRINGYSNLIKSYREPYTYVHNGSRIYRTDVSFNQIYSLYSLDKNLRNAVMASMLDLEEHIKECAATTIAMSFGTDPNDYLNFSNYRDRNSGRFSLGNILNKMRSTLHTDKNPVKHYMEKYNSVPPWILFKSIYFSDIVNFIKLFKANEQGKMADLLYQDSLPKLNLVQKRKLMMDTLFICLEYRNHVAHGGRTYNYICKSSLRSSEIFNIDSDQDNIHGFSQLLFLLGLLYYSGPFDYLSLILNDETNRHCIKFPRDVTYLGQVLNLDIVEVRNVYVSPSSKKYHSRSHCSGMTNPVTMELDEAEKQGFSPCKKCVSLE